MSSYLVAVGATATAVLLRWLLDPVLGDQLPLITLYGAIAIAVGIGGYRPALLAVALGYLACDYLFIEPRGSFDLLVARNLVGLITYLITCSIIVGFGEGMRTALRHAREQADLLRMTFANIGDAVITTDAAGRITYLNPLAEAISGRTLEHARGQPLGSVIRVVNEQTREPVEDPAHKALQEGVAVGLGNHIVLIAKDGAERPIDKSAFPIKDVQGRILGCALILRDITERKRAEDDLRRLATLVESAHDAIYSRTLDGTITTWNAGAERLFGYTQEEAIGRSSLMLIPPDCRGEMEQMHERLLRETHIGPFETRRVCKDGQTVIVSATLSSIKNAAGQVVGIAKIVQDITARKRAEKALADRVAQQAVVAALGQKALAEPDLQALMDEAADTVARVLGVEYCKVLELLPEGRELLVRAGVGWREGLVGHATVGAGEESQAGYTLLATEAVVVDDHLTETRFRGPPFLREHGVVSGMSCRIAGPAGQPFGVIGAHTSQPRHFTPEDVHFLEAIANLLGGVIQRRHFERGLQQSEAKHRAVVNTAVDAIVTINAQGIMQTVNPAAEQLFGYAAEEMIGRNVKLLMPSPYQEGHDDYLARYQATGVKRIIGIGREVVGLRKDGTTFPMDLAVAEASLGKQRLFVGFIRDITERKQTEERFRLVVESAPNAMVMVNADGNIVLVNSQAEKFFGYRREELVGQPVEILVPDRSRASHPRYRASFFASPSIRPMGVGRDLYGRRKDGSEFPVEIGLTPIQTNDGFLVLSAIVDISERKRAEEALRSSHARLAADLETMAKLQELSNRLVHGDNPEGLLPSVLDAAIAVNSADMGNIQLLDQDSGELKIVASRGFEPPFLEFFHAVPQGQAACGMAMQKRERVVIEDITVSPIFAGTAGLDLMLTAGVRAVQSTPLVSRSGRLVGMLSTHYRKPHVPAEKDLQVIDLLARQAADWIERMEAEEELRRNHTGLKKLVAELQAKNEEIRTTTQQLWQAAKLASVGELAASIAHELNNPLATVTLRIESLLDDAPEEDPNRRTLEIVQRETKRMGTLVANLLQFSRRGHEQISTVDIRQELTSTIELVYHHFKKRQIATVQELAPDTPIIYADRQKLRQVFLNLFTNASDAMPQGGTLTLRSQADALAGGKAAVRIEVADTGMGIPADHLEKVFDPYFTTKEEGQGTGLGLAICRRIVEEHHGTIRIDSETGKGSTVIIVLPIRNGTNGERVRGYPPVTEGQSNAKE